MFTTTCMLEKAETPNRNDLLNSNWETVPARRGCAHEGSWAARTVLHPHCCMVRMGLPPNALHPPNYTGMLEGCLYHRGCCMVFGSTALGGTASGRTTVDDLVLDRTFWVAAWSQSGQSSDLGSIGSRGVSRNLVMLELGKHRCAWAGLGWNL